MIIRGVKPPLSSSPSVRGTDGVTGRGAAELWDYGQSVIDSGRGLIFSASKADVIYPNKNGNKQAVRSLFSFILIMITSDTVRRCTSVRSQNL